ncbi:MAG: accessory gene regulator B family protein [Candidatus Galacturonibacter soehngenii]|nr:accessory gene regulator B family protein [Candidatus Galacturonibacter soehngenii]
MAEWLSRRMVEQGIIKEDDEELYQFGIRNGAIILLNVITALLIGLFTTKLIVVIIFTLSFMTLRSYSGGYHSDSRVFCYLGSNLVLFIPVYTGWLFLEMLPLAVIITLVWVVVIIMILSPMHSKKRKLDQTEKKYFSRKARMIVFIQSIVFGVFWYLRLSEYAYAIYSSICIISVFMLVGKVQLLIQLYMEE